jgi:RNA polymerase sigma-70 factor (ECF subfamily)
MNELHDDETLVVAAQRGDLDAWSTLCFRHMPRLAAYLGCRLRRPEVVERVIAEVVLSAWKHLPELEKTADFSPWLRKFGGGLALQWSRKNPDEPIDARFPESRCGSDLDLAQRMVRLDVALGLLPDHQRMLLEQHFRGLVELDELAKSMHVQRDEVERLLDEALIALDRVLTEAS